MHRTTIMKEKPVNYCAVVLAVVFGIFALSSARAQSASDVYKKMTDIYANAKSFQGTIVRVEKGTRPDGKRGTQTVTIKIWFKAPNKYVVNNVTSATISGRSKSSDKTMVTDGKSLFMYSRSEKAYQRGQIPNENMLSRFFAVLNPVNGFLLLPETTVKGRATFVLKPDMPTKGVPTERANAKVTIIIDKQNSQFLKLTIVTANGTLIQSANDQLMNINIPDSIFVWTPPTDYKEVKPPPSIPSTNPK